MSYLMIVFFAFNSLFAVPVEMNFPEFSDKVRKQGKKSSKDNPHDCTVSEKVDGTKQYTCGAGSVKIEGQNRAGESSDYAKDLIQKDQNQRR